MSGRRRFAGAFSLARVSGWSRTRFVVVSVVATLVVSLLSGVPAAAGGAVGVPPVVDGPQSVPVSPVAGRARVVAESESAGGAGSPRSVVWPAAGVADLAVPSSAGASRLRAGALPVWVGPAGEARSGVGAVSRVRVEVLGQDVSARVGVRGVLLRVSGVGGVAGSGRVSVEVDYSGFGHAYGANFGARLTLVSLAGCVLSSPAEASCQRMVPVVGVVNNPVAGRLTARVDVASVGLAGPAAGRLVPEDAAGGGSLFAVAPASVSGGADFSRTGRRRATSTTPTERG